MLMRARLRSSGSPSRPSWRASVSRRALWRHACAVLLLTVLFSWSRQVAAEDPPVPIALQIKLLLKVATYDRNLPARRSGSIRLVVLTKSGNSDSARAAGEATRVLSAIPKLDGVPLEAEARSFAGADELAEQVKTQGVGILYVTPGFESAELSALSRALRGISVLSGGSLPSYASTGCVIGFDLQGGHPSLLVHPRRAKEQHVRFSVEALRLMKVVP
jgi:hypothetical protein